MNPDDSIYKFDVWAGRCSVSLPQNWNPLTARFAGKGVIQSLGRMGVFRRFGYVIPI
jgi:hypothetical protein